MTGDVYGHLESASKVLMAKQFAQQLNPDEEDQKDDGLLDSKDVY